MPRKRGAKQVRVNPRKPVCKQESGLQSLDHLFSRSRKQTTLSGSATCAEGKSTESAILLSDDDDDFVSHMVTVPTKANGEKLHRRADHTIAGESSESQCSSETSGDSSQIAVLASLDEPSTRRRLDFLEPLGMSSDAKPSHNSSHKRERTETSARITEPLRKRWKAGEISESVQKDTTRTLTAVAGKLAQSEKPWSDVVVPTPASPPPRQIVRTSQSYPVTPMKSLSKTPQKSPRISAWKRSPFGKFTKRKSQSLPNMKFKSTYEPYYLANFKQIVNSVRYDKFLDYLFNDHDRKIVGDFNALSAGAKKVYIRLFQRKARWMQCSSIKYPRIAADLSPFIDELVCGQFFESESRLTDLQDCLSLLPAPDLRDVAKKFHIDKSLQKDDLVAAMMTNSRRKTLGAMFGAKGDVGSRMIKE